MMRIMAIDYGDQRTGLAVSDLLGMLCGEAWTVTEWNPERLAEQTVIRLPYFSSFLASSSAGRARSLSGVVQTYSSAA